MREYLVVFTVAAAVTYLLCTVSRVVAERVGAVAKVRDRDVHATPVPYFGGVAMLGGLGAAFLVAHHLPFLSTAGAVAFDDAGAVLAGGAVICLVGVLDDLFELDALVKLGGQLVAAAVVVVLGVQFLNLPLPNALGGTLLLDTRSTQEYEAGHITDARSAPAGELQGKLVDTAKKFKEKPVLVYCENGMTSATTAKKLREQGFTKVVTLRGGLQSWRQENLPLVKSSPVKRKDGKAA